MPQIDINLKRGRPDARKDLVDFWKQENPLSDNKNIIVPYGKEGFDKWGSHPDTETDIVVPIGKNKRGYVLFDFNHGNHLFAGGNMLSGAGMFKRVSLLHLLKTYSPDKVKVILLDTANQMTDFDKSAHLLFPRATKIRDCINLLSWCKKESLRRLDFLSGQNRKSLLSYNKNRATEEELIPDIFIFISEIGDILSEENGLNLVVGIAQIARVLNVHFIITTQRPSPETLPNILKDTFFNRIAFQMPYADESKLFIGQPGAENLQGQGDMLFYDYRNDKIHRLQGLYFKEDDIESKVTELNQYYKSPLI